MTVKMRRIAGFIISMLLLTSSFGQGKLPVKRFSLPQQATSADYENGVLLAKLKPAFRNLASSTSSNGRTASLPDVTIKSLTNPGLVKQNYSARGPFASNESKIDMSLYVKLFVGPGTDIEKKINELYATGYFEIIEPNYSAKIDFEPNDPSSTPALQYYLVLIRAYDAWDISKSDASTVIAIVDSGGDLDHPDLAPNLYTNPDEIPNNNIDDDGDGYKDNVNGWDFIGADTANVFNSNFIGDNNPQLMQSGDNGALGHGVWVAGCASAATNNGIGIAGVGFKAKLLFTKHTADNQRVSAPGIFSGYSGILYAAQTLTADNVSRKIINVSWGSAFRSQIAQDIITHVTLDLGCLVVAAAGNANINSPNYPSSYDYVLSVAATDKADAKAGFSNYGSTVDVTAPGVSIFTTAYNDNYGIVNGTSFSSPITAGAAALVWSKNPTFTPLQVAEQLRVSADNVDSESSVSFKNLLGRGRINIKSALTLSLPSIRASKPKLLNALGNAAELGQESFLTMNFTNYLKSTSNALSVVASSTSPFVTFSQNQVQLGIIGEGGTLRNTFSPVKLVINPGVAENALIQIMLTFSDGVYSDFQFIDIIANPSFITVDDNTITTSIANTGRIGYDDPDNQKNGVGFVVNDNQLLFEMGLMMGTSSTDLYNNVRGINSGFDQDFVKVTPIKEIVPGLRSTSEIFGSFSPSTLSTLLISYRSLAMREAPNDKFVILEYTLKNTSAAAITNFRFGIFADWDISDSGAKDAAGWNASRQIGYVYPKQSTSLPHAGIQVLNTTALYYAIDNSQTIAGNPFGLYDGFTDAEKFTSLSTSRTVAGETTASGNDVSHVVSINPVTIPSGGQVVLAFALHSANNLTELLASADAAKILYNQTFTAPRPIVADLESCFGSAATLTASGATTFKWYKNFTGGTALQTSAQFTTGNLSHDTTLYVSNADQPYESVRTPARVVVKANPAIIASGSSQFCDGGSIDLSVAAADVYTWSTGATTQKINVKNAGNYSVTVKYNALNCTSVSSPFTVKVNPKPSAAFTSTDNLFTGNLITFTDQSTGATSWLWNFGDGSTSSSKNPTHQYPNAQNYSVSLTVTAANGCRDIISKPFDVITGLERSPAESVGVFPNPVSNYLTIQLPEKFRNARLVVINVQGQQVVHVDLELDSEGKQNLFVGSLANGMYLVRVNSENRTFTCRVIIKH